MNTATVDCRNNNWLVLALMYLEDMGFAIVENVLSNAFIAETRRAMYRVQSLIVQDIGTEKLEAAGELGVLRCMFRYDEFFFKYLEIPELLSVINETVTSTAILHLQNGFILPSSPQGQKKIFQNTFHMDFPRVLNGYLSSVNAMFAIDEFRVDNGATIVVPGSHQRSERPCPEYMEHAAVPVECKAGSMILFDSTLWHAAGPNTSSIDRLAINHQFTRSFFKQQIEYTRGLSAETMQGLPDRTQQLLGWYSRPPATLSEYYVSPEKRLYRAGQG